MTQKHKKFMRMAYQQAVYGVGICSPSPSVGAIVVKNEQVLGVGCTMPNGLDHAEVVALRNTRKKYGKEATQGASLYVSLEPCSHYGKNPPCVDEIIASGISSVYIDQIDISEKVNGQGVEALKKRSIKVEVLNDTSFKTERMFTLAPFFKTQKSRLPFVILKWAQTKEGWLAPNQKPSGSITSQSAQEVIHRLRHLFMATLTTPSTVKIDQPMLNVRTNLKTLKLNHIQPSSSFLIELLKRYEKPKLNSCYFNPENLKNHRFFILPTSWAKIESANFYQQQSNIDHQFHLISYSPQQSDALDQIGIPHVFYKREKLFFDSLNYVQEKGHNQLMLEAGPKSAEYLSRLKLADLIICLRNKRKADFHQGRGFSLSNILSEQDDLVEYGYKKIVQFDCGEDTILFFASGSGVRS